MKPEHQYSYSAQKQPHEQPGNPPPSSSKGKKVLFGLGILGWSVLLVALTARVVGVAVGGGVGSALSSCKSDKADPNTKLASGSAPVENTTGGAGTSPSVAVALVAATVTISASSSSSTAVVATIDLSNFHRH